jgi:hypothetical protein
MATPNILEVMNTLTPEQQESVFEFIEFLKGAKPSSPFLEAAREFMDEHPEILRRLAQ